MTLKQRIEAAKLAAHAMRRASGSVECTHRDEWVGKPTVVAVSTKRNLVVFVDGVLYVG